MKNKEYSIPNHGLTKRQKELADEQLRKIRFEKLKGLTTNQKLYADLVALKFELTDYLDEGIFSDKYLFSEFLNQYVKILKISRRKLAEDLGIHETKFSRLINNKENPGLGILYRIEVHSSGLLPASLLWQLVSKKMITEISKNKIERKKQSKLVRNKLRLKSA